MATKTTKATKTKVAKAKPAKTKVAKAKPTKTKVAKAKPVKAKPVKVPRSWADRTFKLPRTGPGSDSGLHSVAYTPDGAQLVVSGWAGLLLLDAMTGAVRSKLRGYTGVTNWDSAVSPDGRWIAAGFGDASIQLYDARTCALIRDFPTDPKAPIPTSVAFSSDSGRVLSAGHRRASLWDVAAGTELARLEAKTSFSFRVAFAGPSKAITCGPDKTVRLWELPSGKELGTIGLHAGAVQALVVTRDGRRALTGGRDRVVKVWDLVRGTLVTELGGLKKQLLSIALSPDERRALSCTSDGLAQLWDLASGALVADFDQVGVSEERDVAFSPDGRWVATTSGEDGVALFDLASL